jgi:hypothetical protein
MAIEGRGLLRCIELKVQLADASRTSTHCGGK